MPEMPQYDSKTSDKYLITREGLLRLDGTAHARYTDYNDGKTLLINSVQEKETLAMRYTYRDNRTQLISFPPLNKGSSCIPEYCNIVRRAVHCQLLKRRPGGEHRRK